MSLKMTDEELLQLIREGQGEEGIRELRARYHGHLVAYAGRQFWKHNYPGPTTADEVVNDVWAEFWAKAPGRKIKNIRQYLFGMVRYQTIAIITGHDTLPLEAAEHMFNEGDDPYMEEERDKLEEKRQAEELFITMYRDVNLTANQFLAVMFRDLGGWSIEEAATHLDTTPETTRVYLSQARGKLRKKLGITKTKKGRK